MRSAAGVLLGPALLHRGGQGYSLIGGGVKSLKRGSLSKLEKINA